jgi:hypothetical protein
MRKFWRIGLVLLIGLSACGDKKAEQAKALQQEIQDLLARNGGNDKTLSHGDITVTPDGDTFAVTIDKVVLAPPQIAPIDLGIIGFKLTTDGDDIRKFSHVSLPASVTVKDTDGAEVKIGMALDRGSGSWSKKMQQLLSADILLKSIEASKPAAASKAQASEVYYRLQSKDNGQGVYDQSTAAGVKLFTFADKDGQLALADLKIASNLGGAKLAEILALRADSQKAAESGKPDQMLPLIAKIFQLFKSVKSTISIGQVTVAAGGTTVFSLGGLNFDFGMEGTDQPKVNVGSSLSYTALSVPQMKDLVGGMGAQIIPTDLALTLKVNDLPVAAILDNWSKTLPESKMGDENAMMGTGMLAAGGAIQVIQQGAVKLTIGDGKLTAPGLAGSFAAEVNNDAKAPMGFTGAATIELSDLDGLIAKSQQYADEPATVEIVGVLRMMRALSDHGTDAAGKPVDRFKVTMDNQGNTLVNGKPPMPPAAPAEPPSNGGGAGTGTGSGSGSGTGQ